MADENDTKDDATDSGTLSSLKAGSTDSQAVRAYYDDWAGSYDAALESWDYRAPGDAAAILGEYLKPGERVLDVGCGTGLFAAALKQRVDCRLDGIDISPASLEIAEARGTYDALQRHDLQAVPLPEPDDAFDAAACIGVLTYIEQPAGLLAELCRVVRPGGHLLFTQRDDRWAEQDFESLIGDFQARGLWTPLLVSEPRPYIPNNDEFADEIRVIHTLCRVS